MILSGDSFWAPFIFSSWEADVIRVVFWDGARMFPFSGALQLREREKPFTGWRSAGWRRYAISRSTCFVNGSEREVQWGGVGLGPSRADRRVPRNQKTSTLKSKTWEYTGLLTLAAALQRPNERWVFSCSFMPIQCNAFLCVHDFC